MPTAFTGVIRTVLLCYLVNLILPYPRLLPLGLYILIRRTFGIREIPEERGFDCYFRSCRLSFFRSFGENRLK